MPPAGPIYLLPLRRLQPATSALTRERNGAKLGSCALRDQVPSPRRLRHAEVPLLSTGVVLRAPRHTRRVPLLRHQKALLMSTTFFTQAGYEHGLKDAMETVVELGRGFANGCGGQP